MFDHQEEFEAEPSKQVSTVETIALDLWELVGAPQPANKRNLSNTLKELSFLPVLLGLAITTEAGHFDTFDTEPRTTGEPVQGSETVRTAAASDSDDTDGDSVEQSESNEETEQETEEEADEETEDPTEAEGQEIGTQNVEEPDATLREMLASTNESEQEASRRIRSLLNSDDANDKRSGERLLSMLKKPEERQLSIDIATTMTDTTNGAQLTALFRLLDDRDKSDAATQIKILMRDAENPQSREGVRTLLTMLNGDERQRADARHLLDMLNDRAASTDGRIILQVLCDNPSAMAGLIELRRDTDRQQTANDVLNLLKNTTTADATKRIIPLLVCAELNTREREQTREDGTRLLGMLKGTATQREQATDIVSALGRPEQIREFFSIVDNSANARAKDELYRMLHSERDAAAAVDLINLLQSQTGYSTHGRQLLSMLNSTTEADRTDARRCLRNFHDMEDIAAVVTAFGKPALRPGLRAVFDGMESESATERDRSHRFVEALTTTGTRDKSTAEDLLRMLGGTDADRQTARTIMDHLEEPSDRTNILRLLNDNNHRATARIIIGDLAGTEHRSAARSLISLSETSDAKTSRLLNMYANAEQRADARLLLNSLDTPAQIHKLLDLRASNATSGAAAELTTMLRSGESNKIASVLRLLTNLEAPFPPERATAESQLQMLTRPQDRALVLGMMTSVEPVHHLRLTKMLNGNDRETARRLVQMAATDGTLVNQTLNVFSESANLAAAVQSLNDTNRPRAVEEIRKMIFEKPGEAQELMKLLAKNQPQGDNVVNLLNDRDRSHEGVALLNSSLSDGDRQILHSLYVNPQRRRGAAALSEALGSENFETRVGALAALRMLSAANNGELNQRGEEFMAMLSNPANSRARSLLDLGPSSGDISAAVGAMSAADTTGIDRLLASSSNPAGRRAVLELMQSDASNRATGSRILEMLANPHERAHAERITATLSTSASVARYMELTSPPATAPIGRREAAAQLRAMMNSDSAEARGVALLMEVPATNRQAEEITLMLASPGARRNEAKAILTGRNSVRELEALLNLRNDATKRVAYATVLEMLQSSDPSKRESARALVQVLGNGGDKNSRTDDRDGAAFIDALNASSTRAVARRALELSKTPAQIGAMRRMLQEPEDRAAIDTLHDLNADVASRADAEIISGLPTPAQIRTMLALRNNPEQAEAFARLKIMLSDETQAVRAQILLQELSGPAGNARNSAAVLLRMLNNPEKQERAELVLNRMIQPLPSAEFLRTLFSSDDVVAGDFIADLLQRQQPEQMQMMLELSEMLVSQDINTRVEAGRVLRMLNDRQQQNIAMRLLQRRVDARSNQGNSAAGK